jgi:myo-inositol-1(or 4)-monophosphatase
MLRSALLNVMIKAARKASRTLKRDFGELEHLQVSLKGPANFVTAADRRAEEIVREELEQARPGYTFVGEEGGVREGSDDELSPWHPALCNFDRTRARRHDRCRTCL